MFISFVTATISTSATVKTCWRRSILLTFIPPWLCPLREIISSSIPFLIAPPDYCPTFLASICPSLRPHARNISTFAPFPISPSQSLRLPLAVSFPHHPTPPLATYLLPFWLYPPNYSSSPLYPWNSTRLPSFPQSIYFLHSLPPVVSAEASSV